MKLNGRRTSDGNGRQQVHAQAGHEGEATARRGSPRTGPATHAAAGQAPDQGTVLRGDALSATLTVARPREPWIPALRHFAEPEVRSHWCVWCGQPVAGHAPAAEQLIAGMTLLICAYAPVCELVPRLAPGAGV